MTNDLATSTNADSSEDSRGLGASIMTPREITAELDKHIVGQASAKRAVAIALRNRWRRMNLSEALRHEVTPKNILMIGPTGVGKTEIARRLAKLAQAPFIKVEATKFTEVGYVGRDVESICAQPLTTCSPHSAITAKSLGLKGVTRTLGITLKPQWA